MSSLPLFLIGSGYSVKHQSLLGVSFPSELFVLSCLARQEIDYMLPTTHPSLTGVYTNAAYIWSFPSQCAVVKVEVSVSNRTNNCLLMTWIATFLVGFGKHFGK